MLKRIIALAAIGYLGGGVAAQAQAQPGASFAPAAEDPGTALSRNLTAIAANPRNVAALTGAGRAAIALGDAYRARHARRDEDHAAKISMDAEAYEAEEAWEERKAEEDDDDDEF